MLMLEACSCFQEPLDLPEFKNVNDIFMFAITPENGPMTTKDGIVLDKIIIGPIIVQMFKLIFTQ